MAVKKKKTLAGPDQLRMELFAPGMSILHRAGLGGLASTLRHLEQQRASKLLDDDRLPGSPWEAGQPPWTIDARGVTLHFGQPGLAREYLRRLFALAFDLRNGLIYLPGQYPETDMSLPMRADLQQGLLLTFLQHGRVRKLAKEEQQVQYDPEGEGEAGVTVVYRACTGYTHQDGWEALTDEKTGCLRTTPSEVSGPLSPGTVVRHVAFTSDTRAEQTPELLLPLYFALVGTLALPMSRVEGALIVPLFEDLELFAEVRPSMTPTTARECQIGSPADGALQAQLRLRGRRLLEENQLPVCLGMRFAQTPWASQQRSRVDTVMVPAGQDVHLDRFDIALHDLPTRIVTVQREEATGRGRQRQVTRQWTEAFRAPSLVRPLVAENLARRRPWYAGFVRLMTALDDNKRPMRDRLGFEREGLQKMIDNPEMWDQQTEVTLVKAVHEALRSRYRQIRRDLPDYPVGRRNRFQREYERRRLAFSGAKTADSFRNALAELISRAGWNPVLRSSWQTILPLLSDRCWQKGRDLALLALASYSGTKGKGK